MSARELLIQGGRLLDPLSGLDAVGDLLVRDGVIAELGAAASRAPAETIPAHGLVVCPGLMDLHVHLREPGEEHKETVATGTRAAAAGGFTVVVCEPNTAPPRDTAERIAELLAIVRRDAVVQVLPKGCITLGQQGEQVAELAALRAAGAVAASDDGRAVADAGVMREAMRRAKALGMPLTVHTEGPAMVARDIGLAAEVGGAVHFSHVSLAEEADLIMAAQQRGLRVTGEVTPHHLALCAEEAPAEDANYRVNPPLRSARDRAALGMALRGGVISVVASDHAPHSPEEKALPYHEAPPGVIGLETTLGVIWTDLVRPGLLSELAALRAMTAGPAAVLGREPPGLRPGGLADITLFDPEAQWVVDPRCFHSKGRNCPFSGRRLYGKAVGTISAGRVVMRDGEILGRG